MITRAIVDYVKEKGAYPFIVPAMGSHGGAKAESQKELLAGYGITEEAMGCPIRSSMETVLLGYSEYGKPVYQDKMRMKPTESLFPVGSSPTMLSAVLMRAVSAR